jgi:hypothetical protein
MLISKTFRKSISVSEYCKKLQMEVSPENFGEKNRKKKFCGQNHFKRLLIGWVEVCLTVFSRYVFHS